MHSQWPLGGAQMWSPGLIAIQMHRMVTSCCQGKPIVVSFCEILELLVAGYFLTWMPWFNAVPLQEDVYAL